MRNILLKMKSINKLKLLIIHKNIVIIILFLINLILSYYNFLYYSSNIVSLKFCEITIIGIIIKFVFKGTIKINYKNKK